MKTKKGGQAKIKISCCKRGWTKPIYTSNEIDIPGQSGQKSHELNVRSVMGFREIGQGLKSMKTSSPLIGRNLSILRHTMPSTVAF